MTPSICGTIASLRMIYKIDCFSSPRKLSDMQFRMPIVVLLIIDLLTIRFFICQYRELSRFYLARLSLDRISLLSDLLFSRVLIY